MTEAPRAHGEEHSGCSILTGSVFPSLPSNSPGGSRHDAPAVSRTGRAAVRGVVAHAKVVAHLVGHGGGHADGILGVVLPKERVQVKKTSPPAPWVCLFLARPHSCPLIPRSACTDSVMEACAFNRHATSVVKGRGQTDGREGLLDIYFTGQKRVIQTTPQSQRELQKKAGIS